MEKGPAPEHESIEQRLKRQLKEKGYEDPETQELLLTWTREQEHQVETSGDPTAPIELNLNRARLYLACGYADAAMDSFEAARTQAWNEHREALYEAIMAEMDKAEDELARQASQ